MSTNRAPAAAPAGPASAPASTSATTPTSTTRPTNTSNNPSVTKPAAAAQASVVIKEEDPKVETLIATVEGASPGAGNMAAIAASARQIAAECRRQQALARSVPVPPTNTISLASNDGRVFSVRVEVARRFGIVRDMLDHNILQAEVAAGESSEPVPLSRISGPTLELAIAWAENYLKRHPRSPTTSSTASTTAVKSERGQQATTSSSSKGRSTSEEGPEIFYRRPKKVGGGGSGANKASSSSSSATASEEHASAVMQYRRSMHDLEYWDSEFLGALSPGKLQDLLNAANYLDSAELLESTCKMIARMIQAQLELDGPSGVAAFMQVPVAISGEEQRKRKAEKEAKEQAASTETGGNSAGIPAAVKLNATGPTHTVNGVINSCERRVRMKLKSSGQIKSEDDDGEVTWAGLVLPELYIEAGGSNSRRRAEVSTQAPEPGVEVSDAFVID